MKDIELKAEKSKKSKKSGKCLVFMAVCGSVEKKSRNNNPKVQYKVLGITTFTIDNSQCTYR
jgi:hypothetical protein